MGANGVSVRVLLVSGSNRAGSTNSAVLRTAAALAPPDVEPVLFEGIGALPLFNPDDDLEGATVHPNVAAMRDQVAQADAVLIGTPEYAGALPAALKNMLEWTIGDAVGGDGVVTGDDARREIAGALGRLVDHARASRSR